MGGRNKIKIQYIKNYLCRQVTFYNINIIIVIKSCFKVVYSKNVKIFEIRAVEQNLRPTLFELTKIPR